MLSPEINGLVNSGQQNSTNQSDATNNSQDSQVCDWQRTMTSQLNNDTSSGSCNVAERVRNALSSVTARSSLHPQGEINSLQSPSLAAVPNMSTDTSLDKPPRGDKNKMKLNPTSLPTITVKKRFKHSRPMLPSHGTPEKKVKTGLEQISENYVTSVISTIQNAACTSGSGHTTTVQFAPNMNNVNTQMSKPYVAVTTSIPTHKPTSLIVCPACVSPQTVSIGNGFYKCLTCNKTYMPVHRMNVSAPGLRPNAFYGMPPNMNTANSPLLPTPPSPSTKKRGKSSKNQKAETIDLVSSDEEEKQSPSAVPTTPTTTAPCTTSSAEHVGLASRMRLPGGALPSRTNTPTPPPQPSPSPSPTPAATPPLTGEYKFHCNKAMFGELYGHTLAPIRVADNRMYLSLECIIYRNNAPITEKYTLSVGQNDVQQVMVYFGRVPSFVAIETASRFAEVACRRIGRNVLVPSSSDPKKRHIILALVSAFKNDNEAAVEVGYLLSCLSPWTRVKFLALEEATEIIALANLDVDQKELCYGTQLKHTGPVETLLIYPSPPKTGGIPVTNEDVACLAEGTYLNDIIIDFYLKYLLESVLTPSQREKTYIFNSYFYKRLTQKQGSKSTPKQMHASVKKWTRNVDIFEKNFIVIPVNEHCHWYLVVVCFPGNQMVNTDDLNEKDEEVDEDESADFVKETPPDKAVTSETTNAPSTTVPENSETSNVELLPSKDQNVAATNSETIEQNTKEEVVNSKDNPTPMDVSSDMENKDHSEGETKTVPAESSEIFPPLPPEKPKIVYPQANAVDEFLRPCILIFDSLVGSGHNRVFTNLRNYITEEWSSRKPDAPLKIFDKSTMKGCYPKIPRQNNDCDCGVFLLQYVESFFTQPIKSYQLPIHLEEWFTLELVSKKREQIKELINTLALEYKKNSAPKK